MIPVVPSRVSPLGSLPAVTDNTIEPLNPPPTWAVYDWPNVASGIPEVATIGAGMAGAAGAGIGFAGAGDGNGAGSGVGAAGAAGAGSGVGAAGAGSAGAGAGLTIGLRL